MNGADPNAILAGSVPLVAVALRHHRFDIAEALAENGLNPRTQIDGSDILFVVVSMGPKCPVGLLNSLIRAGRDPKSTWVNNQSLLMLALEFGSEECATHLIAAGADVRATSSLGETSLHAAAIGSTGARIEELVAHGLDVNAKMVKGETPLILAASRPDQGGDAEAAIASLLLHGADPCAVDSKGENAFNVAAKHGDTERAKALKMACKVWGKRAVASKGVGFLR
jgi:ankyrin repeat protein